MSYGIPIGLGIPTDVVGGSPIIIPIRADTTMIDSEMGRVQKFFKDFTDESNAAFNQIRYMWSYFNHLSVLGFQIIKKTSLYQQAQAQVQRAQIAIQIAQTGFAIEHMITMAMGYMATGNFLLAGTLIAIATSMGWTQGLMAEQQLLAMRNEENARAIADQIEAYSQ